MNQFLGNQVKSSDSRNWLMWLAVLMCANFFVGAEKGVGQELQETAPASVIQSEESSGSAPRTGSDKNEQLGIEDLSGDGKESAVTNGLSTNSLREQQASTESVVGEKQTESGGEFLEEADSESKSIRYPAVPARLPDGRDLRPIGLFMSQMDVLIPRDYLPVAVSRLREAIEKGIDEKGVGSSVTAVDSLYVVELVSDQLICRRGEVRIDSDIGNQRRLPLGSVNVSVEPTETRLSENGIDLLAPFEFSFDGDMIANVSLSGPTKIQYQWTLRGVQQGNKTSFLLKLPSTPQCKILLAVPLGTVLKVLNAAALLRSDTPQEVVDLVRSDEVNWYEIDAGGLAEVQLETIKISDSRVDSLPIVRRSQVQYEVNASGIEWISRIVFESPRDERLPTLHVYDATVTSVQLNGVETAFSIRNERGKDAELQVDLTNVDMEESADLSTLTIRGFASGYEYRQWLDLPRVVIEDAFQASVSDEIQLAVSGPIEVAQWELPREWRQTERQRLESGIIVLKAVGPNDYSLLMPDESPSIVNGVGSSEVSQERLDAPRSRLEILSRVQLVAKPTVRATEVLMSVEPVQSAIRVEAFLDIELDPERASPVLVNLEGGWILETLLVSKTGRPIASDIRSSSTTQIEIWPEPGEIEDGHLQLTAIGTRVNPFAGNQFMVPAFWFLQAEGASPNLLSCVLPPSSLAWTEEVVLVPGRIAMPDLSETQLDFFGINSPRSLWFAPEDGVMPSLTLERPSIAYSADLEMSLGYEDGELIEELTIELKSQSQAINRIVVQTGDDTGIPKYVWLLKSDSSAVPLNSANVVVNGSQSGAYTFDLSGFSLANRKLIGRRRFTFGNTRKIALPSVPGATSQDAEVLLHPQLRIVQRSGSSQFVPLTENAINTVANAETNRVQQNNEKAWTRVRYDAVRQPVINLVTNNQIDVNVIWGEDVKLLSSTRGLDRITAVYRYYSASDLEVRFDPSLRLISANQGGGPVDLRDQTDNRIVVEPTYQDETLQLVWERSNPGGEWMRQCLVPEIVVEGAILGSRYRFYSTPDSFIPLSLKPVGSSQGLDIDVKPGQQVWLVRHDAALSFGWLAALLSFGIGWFVAKRSIFSATGLILLGFFATYFWWSWLLAITGWILLPLVASALMVAAINSHVGENEDGKPEHHSDKTMQQTMRDTDDFSYTGISRVIWLALATFFSSGVITWAQDNPPVEPQQRRSPVNILVPVDSDGAANGEMVYIPRTLFNDLYVPAGSDEPNQASFLTAEYRIAVSPNERDSGKGVFSRVEAEFVVRNESPDQVARKLEFPLLYDTVRRLELIGESTRIIPFEESEAGILLTAVPPQEIFRVRATLKPKVSRLDRWHRMEVTIPIIANSQLIVDSLDRLDAVRIDGEEGWLIDESEDLPRSWVDNLGPRDSLSLDVRLLAREGEVQEASLGRRYWIRAGKEKAVVDCEIDVPEQLAAGEEFQFVVLDSRMPRLIGNSWKYIGSELYSPSRRLVTVKCMTNTAGPIQLVWSQNLQWSDSEGDGLGSVDIPEVIAAALGDNADAWMAVQCDSDLQFLPIVREAIEPIAVDQFLAAWTGFRGSLDRSFVTVGDIFDLPIQAKVSDDIVSDDYHHAHVTKDELQLRFRKQLKIDEGNFHFPQLVLPKAMKLVRLQVDDREQSIVLLSSDRDNIYHLGNVSGTDSLKIEVFATMAVQPNVPFKIPRVKLSPNNSTSKEYIVTRDSNIEVTGSFGTEVSLDQNEIDVAMSMPWISKGSLPVGYWAQQASLEDMVDDIDDIELEIVGQTNTFDCDQLITLKRDERSWLMETHLRVNPTFPDLLDVELPAVWCEELEVVGGSVYHMQTAIDSSKRVLRIKGSQSDGTLDRSLIIRSKLSTTSLDRVSVPSLLVLGSGRRTVYLGVPRQIDGEVTQWRTSAVNLIALPKYWQNLDPLNDYQIYLAANRSWSIDLAPIVNTNAPPIAFSADNHLFPDGGGYTVFTRWDLFPGSAREVEITIPVSAELIGAWVAGRSVSLEVRNEGDYLSLTLPIGLDRYSQSIEVIIRNTFDLSSDFSSFARMRNVRSDNEWMTIYQNSESTTKRLWDASQIGDPERLLYLAESVVQSVEAVDAVNQRPAEEVRAWLRIWFERYTDLSNAANRQKFTLSTESKKSKMGDVAKPLRENLSWIDLDQRMADYADRFRIEEQSQVGELQLSRQLTFPVQKFAGYESAVVWRMNEANVGRFLEDYTAENRGFVLPGLPIFLFVVWASILLLIQRNSKITYPVLKNPAFWMGILGLLCWAVAPIPLAATIVIMAITLPLLSNLKLSHRFLRPPS
ncbi:hypothetical protein OAA19_01205 [Rubripirellula sp.]|nr:hypothetical protein [Rubripirellula sp.]MDB4338705.1 hypothetical protein [Rubripirellula sp.]